jgi:hypothetical protein
MVVYIRQPMNYMGIYYNSTVNNLHDFVTLIEHQQMQLYIEQLGWIQALTVECWMFFLDDDCPSLDSNVMLNVSQQDRDDNVWRAKLGEMAF